MFRKTNISYHNTIARVRIRRVRNVSFLENSAYVLNESPQQENSMKPYGIFKLQDPRIKMGYINKQYTLHQQKESERGLDS